MPGLIATQTLLDYAEQAGMELPEALLNQPAELARIALDGLEAGDLEILDDLSRQSKAGLAGPPQALAL